MFWKGVLCLGRVFCVTAGRVVCLCGVFFTVCAWRIVCDHGILSLLLFSPPRPSHSFIDGVRSVCRCVNVMQAVNQTCLSNRRVYADLFARLLSADVEGERVHRVHWRRRVNSWRKQKTELAVESFRCVPDIVHVVRHVTYRLMSVCVCFHVDRNVCGHIRCQWC